MRNANSSCAGNTILAHSPRPSQGPLIRDLLRICSNICALVPDPLLHLLRMPVPQGQILCTYVNAQEISADLSLEMFPWNDDVTVVDDPEPTDAFSLQPEENAVRYGAGVVIMQSTWVRSHRTRLHPATRVAYVLIPPPSPYRY